MAVSSGVCPTLPIIQEACNLEAIHGTVIHPMEERSPSVPPARGMNPMTRWERGGSPKGLRYITAHLGRPGQIPAAATPNTRCGVPRKSGPGFPQVALPHGHRRSIPRSPMEPAPTECMRDWLARWLMCLCARDTTSGQEDRGLPVLRDLLHGAGRQHPRAAGGRGPHQRAGHLGRAPGPLLHPPGHRAALLPGPAGGRDLLRPRRLRCQGAAGGPAGCRARRCWPRGSGTSPGSGWWAKRPTAPEPLLPWRSATGSRAAWPWSAGSPRGSSWPRASAGVQHYVLRCRGRAAHSSTPEQGSSALWPLLDWLQALRQLPRPTDPELGPELWNLGLLSGGDAPNVVPDFAQAHVHARVLPGSDLESRIRGAAAPPGRGGTEALRAPGPLPPPSLASSTRPMPFGSDTPQLRALVPDRTAVLAGPGSIQVAHGPGECISLPELEAGVDLNRRLALHFLAEGETLAGGPHAVGPA